MRKVWMGLAVVCLMALATGGHAQVGTTLVQDTVNEANGTPGTGSVIVSWPGFSTMSGQAVAAGTTTVVLGANGAFSVSLAPNAGAMPIGTYYTAVYHLGDGTVSREYWVVPVTSSAVTISSIRSTVLPLSVAMQTVSKAYVDNAISALAAGGSTGLYVLKTGDTMSGALVLPGDPTSANQAADKHYVDVGTAALTAGLAQKVSTLPAGAQTVNQPTGTSLGVNDLNGVFYASQYQTGVQNNGIANVTQSSGCTSGCSVVAEPNYAAVEQPSGYNQRATSSFGWPAQTHLKDLRGGGTTDSFQDPINPFLKGHLDGHTILYAGTLSAASMKALYGTADSKFAAERIIQGGLAGGNTQEVQNGQTPPYDKTTYTALDLEGVYATEGQHVMSSSSMNCLAVGDCLIAGYTMVNSGGWRDNADEGAHPGGMKISEDSNVPVGTCAAGCTAGSTQVSVGGASYPMGEGRFLMDKNPAHVVTSGTTGCALSGGLEGNYPLAEATFSGSNCFPLSVFFLASAPVGPQANTMSPGTVVVAIATTGLPSGYATNTAAAPSGSGVACVADTLPAGRAESSFETAAYSVVDATHISVTFNKPHGYAPTIAMGGMCGYGLEATVDTRGAIRQVVPVVGSYSATGLYYAANNVVGIGVTGGTSAFANVSSNISSISRTGNVATVVLTNSIGDLNGVTATVSGVADSSFNGSFPIAMTSGNSFTYANTGANGSSSGGAFSFTTGGFNLYPMAEVLGVLNPATNAVDGGNVKLAANTVSWAMNDPLEEPHFHLMLTQGDGGFSLVSQTMPRPNYGESLGDGMQFGGYNGNNFVGYLMTNQTPASAYFGNGGTLGAPKAALQVQGAWANVLDVPAGESTVINVHCNSHGCNQWDSPYNLFALQTTGGGSTATIGFSPASNTLSTTIANWAFGNASVGGIGALSAGSLSIGGGAAIGSSSNLCQTNGTNCPSGGGGGIALGTAGQVPVMNAGGTAYAPVTLSGDATVSSSGVVTAGGNVALKNAANTFTNTQTITGGPFNFPLVVTESQTGTTGVASFLQPSLATSSNTYISFGKAATLNNSAALAFIYGAAGSATLNLGAFSLYGNAASLTYDAQGDVVIEKLLTVPAVASVLQGSETVASSATPTFSTATRASINTLTANVTSFTLAAGADGQEKTLTFCQNATGSYTVAAPANVHGFFTVGATASKCSSQHFTYYAGQAAWLADSAGVVNE